MGIDKKSEKKKRKRDSPSGSEGEHGRSKRDRKSDSKKEKRKDKKSSHKHRSDKEKKSKDKRKDKHQKHDRPTKHDFKELSIDDYFSKNNEFATWLAEKKKVFFSELSSESAHELFSDFVNNWNNQKLDSKYYEGITSGPRTAHNWKIRK